MVLLEEMSEFRRRAAVIARELHARIAHFRHGFEHARQIFRAVGSNRIELNAELQWFPASIFENDMRLCAANLKKETTDNSCKR